MAESLKEVIAKLKAQQNSQASVPTNKQEKPVEPVVEVDDEDFEEEEEVPAPKKAEPKPEPKPQKENVDDEIRQIQETISSLHDNGVYRLELLNNLKQINKNLTIIAGVLLEISGYGNKQ